MALGVFWKQKIDKLVGLDMFRIFMIGWEYPPNITGGLGMACFGIARALSSLGDKITFLLPEIKGNEWQLPNVDLMDVKREIQSFNARELQELLTNSEKKTNGEYVTQSFGAYESSSYSTNTGMGSTSKLETKKEYTAEWFSALDIQSGYTNRIFQDIHRYAHFSYLQSKRMDIDVVHCHDWMTYPAGIAAADGSGKPLVCHVHATEFDRSGEKVNQYVYDMEREAFHRADAIVTVSNYTKEILKNRYSVPEHKIFPVHNGIDFEIEPDLLNGRKEKPIHDHIVLFMGRITFQKGPDYFVKAAKRVIEQVKNVRFVMAGTGDMYARMIELAADMGLGKYFHYTGFLKQDQIKRLYNMTDVYIMPSVSEPFGLSTLEAMAHGVPVIVSKQSGVSEVVENCIKVDFWNVDDLADRIIRVLQDKQLHSHLAENGSKEARQISWFKTGEKLQSLYSKLIQE